MLYRCLNCGKIFEEPGIAYQYSEFWGIPEHRLYNVSPCCKEDYEEIDDEEDEEDAVREWC